MWFPNAFKTIKRRSCLIVSPLKKWFVLTSPAGPVLIEIKSQSPFVCWTDWNVDTDLPRLIELFLTDTSSIVMSWHFLYMWDFPTLLFDVYLDWLDWIWNPLSEHVPSRPWWFINCRLRFDSIRIFHRWFGTFMSFIDIGHQLAKHVFQPPRSNKLSRIFLIRLDCWVSVFKMIRIEFSVDQTSFYLAFYIWHDAIQMSRSNR